MCVCVCFRERERERDRELNFYGIPSYSAKLHRLPLCESLVFDY